MAVASLLGRLPARVVPLLVLGALCSGVAVLQNLLLSGDVRLSTKCDLPTSPPCPVGTTWWNYLCIPLSREWAGSDACAPRDLVEHDAWKIGRKLLLASLAGQVAAVILTGAAVDAFGRRPAILAAMLVSIVRPAYLAIVWAITSKRHGHLLVSAGLAGVSACADLALNAAVADALPRDEAARGAGFLLLSVSRLLGARSSWLLGGTLLQLGPRSYLVPWAGCACGCAALFWLLRNVVDEAPGLPSPWRADGEEADLECHGKTLRLKGVWGGEAHSKSALAAMCHGSTAAAQALLFSIRWLGTAIKEVLWQDAVLGTGICLSGTLLAGLVVVTRGVAVTTQAVVYVNWDTSAMAAVEVGPLVVALLGALLVHRGGPRAGCALGAAGALLGLLAWSRGSGRQARLLPSQATSVHVATLGFRLWQPSFQALASLRVGTGGHGKLFAIEALLGAVAAFAASAALLPAPKPLHWGSPSAQG